MASEFAHAMRAAELEQAASRLPKGGKLLELGAGDGWQAHALHQHGFDVTAIDVETTQSDARRHFPVSFYDGRTLPFPDGSFDAIYSSNVLEHVIDFARIQSELARVLRPGGIAVHCVPSAVWRFWTTVGHPFYAARLAWRLKIARATRANPPGLSSSAEKLVRDGSLVALFRTGLISPRHGEYGSLFSEHWLFSSRGWNGRFEQTGWHVGSMEPTSLFYTGNELFGSDMTTRRRRTLASFLGSSTLIYVLHPKPQSI